MKRCWLGIVLLAALLGLGLYTTAAMNRIYTPISRTLETAGHAALAEDWEQTLALTQKARTSWEKNRRWSAAAADHDPMEEIEGEFARLSVYLTAHKPEEAAAVCARLSRLTAAMSQAHTPTWWNLL